MTTGGTSPLRVLHLGNSGVYVRELFKYLRQRQEAEGHVFVTRWPPDESVVPDAEEPPPWLHRAPGRRAFLRTIFGWGHDADKIVLHGLFDELVLLALTVDPTLRAKTCWIVWGSDLYVHQRRESTPRGHAVRAARRFTVRRIPEIATHVPGDADLCRSWFGWDGDYIESITYPNSVVRHVDVPPRPSGAPLRVLAGNSASEVNDHLDLFARLRRVDDGSMTVFCPLAYGSDDVRTLATATGRDTFGDRFVPLLDMMSVDTYLRLLSTMDLAVFNHRRQHGVGNILALLGMGKRVFLRRETTTWHHLSRLGVHLSDIEDLDLEPGFRQAPDNVHILRRAYGEDRLVEGLERVFAPRSRRRGTRRPG